MDVPINLGASTIKVETVLKDEDLSNTNLPVATVDAPVTEECFPTATENETSTNGTIPVLETTHSAPSTAKDIIPHPDFDDDGTRPFPCDHCAISFVDRLQLAVHERVHGNDKVFPCDKCGIVFYQALALMRHERSHRTRPTPKQKDERRRSQRSKVTGIAPLRVTCGGCDEEFEEIHMREHHVGYFWCSRCKRVFGLRCQWRKHGCPGRPGRPPANTWPPSPEETPAVRKKRGRPPGRKNKKPRRPRVSEEDDSPVFDPDNLHHGWDEEMVGAAEVEVEDTSASVPEGLGCEICGLTFANERGARRHFDTKHGNQTYDCEVCERKFNRLDSLVTHSVEAHNQTRQVPCMRCSRMFTQQRIVEYHMVRAHSKRANGEEGVDGDDGTGGVPGTSDDLDGYRCDECGRNFRNRVRLAEHRHSVHEEPGHRFQCELCDVSCTRVDELTKHTVVVHNQEKIHHCDRCNKASFTQKSLLEYHKKIHDIPVKPRKMRQYKCKECKQRFVTELELSQHECMGPPELSSRRPICDICGRTCCNTGALRRHQLHHSTERPAVCDICGARFVDKYALTQHKITHSTERPHVCHICGKGFRVKGTFMRHVKFHSGDRPHVCEQCGKAFKTNLTLIGHMRIHTGEKPFVCTVCSRPFRLPHQLKTHMKVHDPGRTKKAKGQDEWESSAAAATTSGVTSSVASPESERSLPVPVRPPWLSPPVTTATTSQDSQERPISTPQQRVPWLHGPGAPPMPVVQAVQAPPTVPSPGSERNANMGVPRPPWM